MKEIDLIIRNSKYYVIWTCWVVSTQFGSNMDNPNVGLKIVLKCTVWMYKENVQSESWSWINIL